VPEAHHEEKFGFPVEGTVGAAILLYHSNGMRLFSIGFLGTTSRK
jgi:hypothetical protein